MNTFIIKNNIFPKNFIQTNKINFAYFIGCSVDSINLLNTTKFPNLKKVFLINCVPFSHKHYDSINKIKNINPNAKIISNDVIFSSNNKFNVEYIGEYDTIKLLDKIKN